MPSACRSPRNRIEHTRKREVIKTADWVLDLGPQGGDKGGEIVAEGTRDQVAREPRSYTGQYLAPLLAKSGGAGPVEKTPSSTLKRRQRMREAAK